ncbi:outer membrane beta-barrel protein [Geotalea toluenoxydans]|uniref:outer membrane beta-barrel protein n=1 Tax=Geotalea toluenoxydans TaxID=421624 RepID=UPI0006CFD8D2|nr:outer membrane beta-barrel protein [Geotalea toluenoxydans]
MKKITLFSLVIAFLLSVNLSWAADEADKPANYLAIKGGIYSPSNDFDVQEIPGDSTVSRLDNKIGFAGEVALGHYIMPVLAMELGAGYFESKGSGEAVAGQDARLRVVPVVLTAKVLLPLGPVEPYGEFGVGGYFSKVRDFKIDESTNTKAMFGLHAGAGLNFNITDSFFLGLEGRYLWTDDSWGSSDANLDGFITTAALGFRY